MSIASEITRLQNAKSNLKSKLQDKGVSVGNERLDEMVNLVDNIQGGSGIDTTDATATASDILLGKTAYVNDEKIEGTIETYDGASDVGSSEDLLTAIQNNTLTSYSNNDITKVRDEQFQNCTNLESVDLPNVLNIGNSAFSGCSKLNNINIPNVTTISMSSFASCKELTAISMPKITRLENTSCWGCSALTEINIPNCTGLGNECLGSCTSLTNIKLPSVSGIGRLVFSGCTVLTDIYFGYDGLVSLNNSNSFKNVPAGCRIHVRSEYADQYATATNWSSLIASGQIVIVGDYSD